MEFLIESFEASHLAGWVMVVMGSVACAAMGWSRVFCAQPSHLLVAAVTITISGLLGGFGITDYYLSFMIVSASAMAPAIVTRLTRSDDPSDERVADAIVDEGDGEPMLRMIDHHDDDAFVMPSVPEPTRRKSA